MIAGTLVIEDSTINFNVSYDYKDGPKVIYTVTDNLVGLQETKTVPAEAFMTALGIALSFDGDIPDNKQGWIDAESVQPENKNLRFIP